ncbi:hypothetical protein AVEN_102291-1 [Araneus ventricosus]|uniref:Uncharacterized protein n=1 Tax=Araneus ventricosus TaxID=182803 RepID=A0A4Y2IGS8_ARAVE|nr:hypothetical protein AVEN_102291-1 [Araneus ventricosus]
MKSNSTFKASTGACFSNPKLPFSIDSSKAGFWLIAKNDASCSISYNSSSLGAKMKSPAKKLRRVIKFMMVAETASPLVLALSGAFTQTFSCFPIL